MADEISLGIFEDNQAIYLSRKVGDRTIGAQVMVPQDVGGRIRAAMAILANETAALTELDAIDDRQRRT